LGRLVFEKNQAVGYMLQKVAQLIDISNVYILSYFLSF